jgi:hypothetical protein
MTDSVLGEPQATRADGIRDLPLANELLRDHTCRTHPQSILKVRFLGFCPRILPAVRPILTGEPTVNHCRIHAIVFTMIDTLTNSSLQRHLQSG